MQRLVQSVENGRSPADDFADNAISSGIEGAVLEMARVTR
jgi:glutamate--cysteine ligase